MASNQHLDVLVWGLADFGKPRTRILLSGLSQQPNIEIRYLVRDIWAGVEDKSQIKGLRRKFNILWAVLSAYPILLMQFFRSPRPDVVLIPYMGVFDILVLKAAAAIRGTPIVWDAFLSLFDTIVDDRKMVREESLTAAAIRLLEGAACRCADTILLDTKAHAEYFEESYPACKGKTRAILVGAETLFFERAWTTRSPTEEQAFSVLFYGQCIPLHGIRWILDAINMCEDPTIRWELIGDGQDVDLIQSHIKKFPNSGMTWTRWVDYENLPARIASADLCLGIFGDSAKAARVIPNKIFQYAAMGMPFVTRCSPAISELFDGAAPGVFLVEPASPSAILAAVEEAKEAQMRDQKFHRGIEKKICPNGVGASLNNILRAAATSELWNRSLTTRRL
ncbi:MAG: glycosyltransferase [Pseudomonadota bacterium]